MNWKIENWENNAEKEEFVLGIEKQNGDVVVLIKTPEKFENTIGRVNTITKSSRLFRNTNSELEFEFYKGTTLESYDDINAPLFSSGEINPSILRLVGTSKGLKLTSVGLVMITEEQAQDYCVQFKNKVEEYIRVINSKIDINIKAEVD